MNKAWMCFSIVFCFLFSHSVFAKGPLWNMELPTKQSSLFAPYAKHFLTREVSKSFKTYFYKRQIRKALRRDSHDLGLLGLHSSRRLPQQEHSYPFYNNGRDLSSIAKYQYGYCVGFSFILRKFHMLAFYRPEEPRLENVEDYYSIIDSLVENRPQYIPGYENLYEFASDPQIANYLKTHIVDQWALKNINFRGIQLYGAGLGKLRRREVRKLYRDVKAALALGYNPIMSYALKPSAQDVIDKASIDKLCELEPYRCEEIKKEFKEGLSTGINRFIDKTGNIHVIPVYDLKLIGSDGDFELKLWDINRPFDQATNTITVFHDGGAKVKVKKEVKEGVMIDLVLDISDIRVHPKDEAEIGEMLHRLKKFCRKYSCH